MISTVSTRSKFPKFPGKYIHSDDFALCMQSYKYRNSAGEDEYGEMGFSLTLLMVMQCGENYQAAKCVRERVIRKGMLNI